MRHVNLAVFNKTLNTLTTTSALYKSETINDIKLSWR